jgi:XTP/dITP diphosphohydrolase
VTRIVVATSNPAKIAEIGAALAEVGVEVLGFDGLSPGAPVEETGSTFEENARIKAEAYSLRTELPVLADDSGIEVDALNGAPGVQSARYGGPEVDDPGRNRLLLDSLRGVPSERRTARFRCVLAVARNGRTLAVFHGVVEGRIAEEPRGANGFGYDPIFFHEGIGTTFGEIGRREKQALSHRGQAIARFLEAVRSGSLKLAGSVDAPQGGC